MKRLSDYETIKLIPVNEILQTLWWVLTKQGTVSYIGMGVYGRKRRTTTGQP